MGKYAIVTGDMVANVIIADAAQVPELSVALGAELVDAAPLGLAIGDLRRADGAWTRNSEGEQVVLTGRPTYEELLAKLAALEAAGGDASGS